MWEPALDPLYCVVHMPGGHVLRIGRLHSWSHTSRNALRNEAGLLRSRVGVSHCFASALLSYLCENGKPERGHPPSLLAPEFFNLVVSFQVLYRGKSGSQKGTALLTGFAQKISISKSISISSNLAEGRPQMGPTLLNSWRLNFLISLSINKFSWVKKQELARKAALLIMMASLALDFIQWY